MANQINSTHITKAIAPKILLYCEVITTKTAMTDKFITESGHADKILGT